MGTKLVQKGSRPLAFAQIQLISPVRFRAARGTVARVYAEMEREFGVLAPTVALHSPAPDVLAAGWIVLREALLATGLVDRTTKEAVAAAVSVGNTCPYCVTVHNTMVPPAYAAAIAHDRVETIDDPRLRAITAWVRANATRTGASALATPFPPGQSPEVLAVMVVFQYYNRMVNVFLRDAPLPPGVPGAALRVVGPTLAWLMRSAAPAIGAPGATLDLLPAAPLPPDLSWAAGHPVLADAFARAAAAVEAAGRRAVPDSVRALVAAELAGWDGTATGPSRAWAQTATAGLPRGEQPAGRLALLIAFASYQVDQGVVDEFRQYAPDDRTLVETAAWAALAAARQAGAWAAAAAAPRPGGPS